jgi:hypothetical protein
MDRKQANRYRAGNIECARITAADPGRYPGAMQEWARLVLAKAERAEPAAGRAA